MKHGHHAPRRSAARERKQHVGMQLGVALEALRRTTSLPKGAAQLASYIVQEAALARLKVSDSEARLGAMCAAYLVALDCGQTREESAVWLRQLADNLTTKPKGA